MSSPPTSVEIVACTEKNQALSLVGPNLESRQALYRHSVEKDDLYWSDVARKDYFWKQHWPDDAKVKSYNFDHNKGNIFVKWFEGGLTNMCYNCVDRHLPAHRDRVCFYTEGNDPSHRGVLTYGDVYVEVVKTANLLRSQYGVGKGDRVSIYLPMIPFAVIVLLACARIGAVPSVVFGGFSSQALATRVFDAKPKLLITADASMRGNKIVPLKEVADAALKDCELLGFKLPCLVYENGYRHQCAMVAGRDTFFTEAVRKLSPSELRECPIEWMAAEDPLFILYTSGSTGTPKALVHTTGGYMVYAGTTFKYVFDYHLEDVYFCTADIGWITGHSYVAYGPLLHCATSVLYEGLPMFPNPSRWWEMVDRYKVSLFYTAPTAVRALMQKGEAPVKATNRCTLRVLGSVGEPINAEAWRWYRNVIGNGHVDIVDTWWQTETGGHLITPLPGCTPQRPGCASLPFFGIVPAILDPMTVAELNGPASGLLAIRTAWPGIARTIYNDHERYEKTYFPIPGYYLTGDGARRDADGYYTITGRVDDVLNVSGHRIGTSEVEAAVNAHPSVVESAVVGIPHEIKGESIVVYLTFHQGMAITPELLKKVCGTVRAVIGPLATPDIMIPAQSGLPKTRSGKIVRRILRKIATGKENELGDTTTLAEPKVVADLIASRNQWAPQRKA